MICYHSLAASTGIGRPPFSLGSHGMALLRPWCRLGTVDPMELRIPHHTYPGTRMEKSGWGAVAQQWACRHELLVLVLPPL